MSQPFWTVIIPTRGKRIELLGQCINSVVGQLSDCELLLQDNGRCWPIYSDLRFLNYQHNAADLGCYGSINAAIERSTGQWIHVLPDDDWVQPKFYATMRAMIESNPGYDLAACNCWIANAAGQLMGSNRVKNERETMPQFLRHDNPFNLCQVVVKREVYDDVGLYRTDLEYVGDWEFYQRASERHQWLYEPTPLAVCRRHDGQLTHALVQSGRAAYETKMMREGPVCAE